MTTEHKFGPGGGGGTGSQPVLSRCHCCGRQTGGGGGVGKPDPLVEVIEAWFSDFRQEVSDAASFRTALEARGLEIREKNDD